MLNQIGGWMRRVPVTAVVATAVGFATCASTADAQSAASPTSTCSRLISAAEITRAAHRTFAAATPSGDSGADVLAANCVFTAPSGLTGPAGQGKQTSYLSVQVTTSFQDSPHDPAAVFQRMKSSRSACTQTIDGLGSGAYFTCIAEGSGVEVLADDKVIDVAFADPPAGVTVDQQRAIEISIARQILPRMSLVGGPSSQDRSEPAEACVVRGLEAQVDGQATAGIFAFGDDGSVDVGQRSDGTSQVDVAGDFKVGLGGVFGEGVHTDGEGEGATLSVAGGLQLGAGLGFQVDGSRQAGSLITALESPQAVPPETAQLKSSTFDFGVWLSGDTGVGSAQGSLDASAVLGVKTEYENSVATDSEYYLEVNASADGNVGAALGPDSKPAGLKDGGFLNGDLVVGEKVDANNAPVAGEVTLTGSLGAQGGLGLKPLHLNGDFGPGAQAEMDLSLDLSDPANLALWNQLTSDQGDDTVGGLIGNGSATPADDALAKSATVTVVLYKLSRASTAAQAKFGDGAGLGVKLGGDVTERQATGAQYKPSGSLTLRPWNSCVKGGGQLAQ